MYLCGNDSVANDYRFVAEGGVSNHSSDFLYGTASHRLRGAPSSGGAAEGLVEDYGFVFEGEDFSLDVLLDCPGQDDFLQIATFVG